MNRTIKKLIRDGQFVAEVDVELSDPGASGEGWGPYLSLADARKLDEVRAALRGGDLKVASRLATIYQLTPVKATA